MKRILEYAYVIVLAAVLLTACDQTSKVITDTPVIEEKDLFAPSEYNLYLKDFALAVSKALNKSKDFRSLLKKQALVRFDGDYDVLLTQMVDKPIAAYEGVSLRSSNGTCTVRDLLADSYPTSALRSTGSGASVIDELSEAYPDLQVSIPVHAEEWDESTIPVVAFVPEEYEDCVTPHVAGYDADGNFIAVDALTPPDEPMAIVGRNERMIRKDLVAIESEQQLPAPTNLTATSTQSGILLMWEMSSSVAADVVGYKIYRKDFSESNFSLLVVNNGYANRSHNDVVSNPGSTFFYYVTAYNSEGESFGSNIASAIAPALPEGPTSFSAILRSNTEVELYWTTNPSAYIEKLELSRYVLNQTNGYEWYRDFTTSEFRYFDRNIPNGAVIHYKLQTVNATGASNPLYDMVRVPYRDPSLNSSVQIKRISCSKNLEGWLQGKPELLITVYGVDVNRETTQICSRQINMDAYTKTYNKPLWILDWKPNDWYQIYTFHVVEEDPGKDVEIKIRASIGFKKTTEDGVTLGVEAAIPKGFKFSAPEDCGSADLNYCDPTNTTLYFKGKKSKHWCNISFCK